MTITDKQVEALRADFEAWAAEKGLPLHRGADGSYATPLTAENWKFREMQARSFKGVGAVPAYWVDDCPVLLASTPCFSHAWNVQTKATQVPLYRHPPRAALEAAEAARDDNGCIVDRGALRLALSVLRRAGKNEVADALESAAPSSAEQPSQNPDADQPAGRRQAG